MRDRIKQLARDLAQLLLATGVVFGAFTLAVHLGQDGHGADVAPLTGFALLVLYAGNSLRPRRNREDGPK